MKEKNPVETNANTCIACGKVIPEGQLVCIACESGAAPKRNESGAGPAKERPAACPSCKAGKPRFKK